MTQQQYYTVNERSRVLRLFFDATLTELTIMRMWDNPGFMELSTEVIKQYPELLQVTIEDIVSSYPRPFRLNS